MECPIHHSLHFLIYEYIQTTYFLKTDRFPSPKLNLSCRTARVTAMEQNRNTINKTASKLPRIENANKLTARVWRNDPSNTNVTSIWLLFWISNKLQSGLISQLPAFLSQRHSTQQISALRPLYSLPLIETNICFILSFIHVHQRHIYGRYTETCHAGTALHCKKRFAWCNSRHKFAMTWSDIIKKFRLPDKQTSIDTQLWIVKEIQMLTIVSREPRSSFSTRKSC